MLSKKSYHFVIEFPRINRYNSTRLKIVESCDGFRNSGVMKMQQTARRAAQKKKEKRRLSLPLVVALVIVGVLLAVYCVLCAAAKTGRILPGTSVNGVDVGGMTEEEASQLLEERLSGQFDGDRLFVDAEGTTYQVMLTPALGYDTAGTALKLQNRVSDSFFLARGWMWLSARISGHAVKLHPYVEDEDALRQALSDCGLLGLTTTVETTWTSDGTQLVLTKGTTGFAVNEEELTQQIRDALAKGDWTDHISCPVTETAPAALDLQAVYNEVHTDPINATLDPDNDYAVVPSQVGIDFDPAAAQQALDAAAEGSTVTITYTLTQPDVDTETFQANLFRDVLGEYTTNVSGSAGRRSNVKLAGEYCNGVILMPGDVFDYNQVVGQRTAARGFNEAGAYVNGESVQEVGGGVCQTSSTLYAACLLANLEIVDRTNHSYPSAYIPMGWDATVSWGGPEFRFANNKDYPIKVVSTYSGNQLTMRIYGTKQDDITVKITTEVLETIPAGTVEEPTSALYVGQTEVKTSGHTGYKVQSYRNLYDGNGNLISTTEESYSYYRMQNRVVLVGTTPEPEPEAPAEAPAEGTGGTETAQ